MSYDVGINDGGTHDYGGVNSNIDEGGKWFW